MKSRWGSVLLVCCINRVPSIPGIFTFEMTRSKWRLLSIFEASEASEVTWQVYPALSRKLRRVCWIIASSSTIKIDLDDLFSISAAGNFTGRIEGGDGLKTYMDKRRQGESGEWIHPGEDRSKEMQSLIYLRFFPGLKVTVFLPLILIFSPV